MTEQLLGNHVLWIKSLRYRQSGCRFLFKLFVIAMEPDFPPDQIGLQTIGQFLQDARA